MAGLLDFNISENGEREGYMSIAWLTGGSRIHVCYTGKDALRGHLFKSTFKFESPRQDSMELTKAEMGDSGLAVG